MTCRNVYQCPGVRLMELPSVGTMGHTANWCMERERIKLSSKPKFVNGLDSCMVPSLACGVGHTLFLVQERGRRRVRTLC